MEMVLALKVFAVLPNFRVYVAPFHVVSPTPIMLAVMVLSAASLTSVVAGPVVVPAALFMRKVPLVPKFAVRVPSPLMSRLWLGWLRALVAVCPTWNEVPFTTRAPVAPVMMTSVLAVAEALVLGARRKFPATVKV